MSRSALRNTAVGFILFVLLGASAATAAEAAPIHKRTSTSTAKVRAYWTPKRMARAVDMSRLISTTKRAGVSGAGLLNGPVLGGSSATNPARAGSGGAGSGLRHAPAYQESDPAIGRLFFRWLGRKASCTGSVINTPSKRLVLTAAHCLNYLGVWSSHIYFVPDYDRGRRPYGSWVWKAAWVTRPWARTPYEAMANYDLGMVVTTRSRRGHRVGKVAGALPYNTFPRRNGRTRIYGYPAGKNRGKEIRVCANRRTWRGPWYSHRLRGPVGMAARCNMAAGSSGGPWLSAYRGPAGGTQWIVDGLTSTSGRRTNKLASPYFGSHFRRLVYNAENR